MADAGKKPMKKSVRAKLRKDKEKEVLHDKKREAKLAQYEEGQQPKAGEEGKERLKRPRIPSRSLPRHCMRLKSFKKSMRLQNENKKAMASTGKHF